VGRDIKHGRTCAGAERRSLPSSHKYLVAVTPLDCQKHRSKAQGVILLVSAASGSNFQVKKTSNYARPVAIQKLTTPSLVRVTHACTPRLQLQDRVGEIARV